MRYRVGFESDSTKSFMTERNPGCPAVIDTQGIGVLGTVFCICDNQQDAEWIVELLNTHPQSLK